MNRPRQRLDRNHRWTPVVRVVAVAWVVAACSACAATSDDARPSTSGTVRIVASTNVYGDLAETVAGNHATVTSIIDDPNADPHEFSASTRDMLAVSKADIVIVNGGGYDDFMHTLRDAADNPDSRLLDAVEISGRHATDGELNEHVWYDLRTMASVAGHLRDALVALDPTHADDYRTNTEVFMGDLAELEDRAREVGRDHPGASAAVTEPVPLYLLAAIGLENRTPSAFTEAVEEGEEASPAVLADTLALFTRNPVDLLVVNAQTTDDQTGKVTDAARAAGVPVVAVTETLPAHETYVTWMRANLDAIAEALDEHPSGPGS